MKKILALLLILFANEFFAQNSEALNPIKKEIYTLENVQVAPEFPGGSIKFDEYLKNNFKNPKAKIGTEIIAYFIIEMDGSISHIEIIKDDKAGSGNKLKKLLEKSPKWLQGEHEGYHVRTRLKYSFRI